MYLTLKANGFTLNNGSNQLFQILKGTIFMKNFFIIILAFSAVGMEKQQPCTSFVAHTANILGKFNDPFEFDGDYGTETNHTRQQVFDLVVSKAALIKNLTDSQVKELMDKANGHTNEKIYKEHLIAKATQQDKNHGPTLSEVTQDSIGTIENKLQKLSNTSKKEFDSILEFINKYGNQKIFYFLRNNPAELLKLDKILRDNASKEGKNFNFPVLSSTATLNGHTSNELKSNLIDTVFTKEVFSFTRPESDLKKAIDRLDKNFLQKFFNNEVHNKDLYAFCTPSGQLFFYWLYEALNLHLIGQDPQLIEKVNSVKERFKNTLGNSEDRAQIFKNKFLDANSKVIFVQESDKVFAQALLENNLFVPINKQNFQDGTVVFLKNDFWEPDYEIIPIEDYSGYEEGRLTTILATQKQTKQKFLLAACHGSSTKSEDGRMQIEKIIATLNQLSQKLNEDIKLVIGIDANTKTEEDVTLFKELLNRLGLIATEVGPTTVKRRMVTVQHAKAGKFAIDAEDYLIVKKGQFLLNHHTVGFSKNKADVNMPLPSLHNPSDHYAVGAQITSIK